MKRVGGLTIGEWGSIASIMSLGLIIYLQFGRKNSNGAGLA